jgi:hypothetical protein
LFGSNKLRQTLKRRLIASTTTLTNETLHGYLWTTLARRFWSQNCNEFLLLSHLNSITPAHLLRQQRVVAIALIVHQTTTTCRAIFVNGI